MAQIIDFSKMKETFQIRKDLNTDYTAMVMERLSALAEYNQASQNPLFNAFGESYQAIMALLGPIQTSCLTFGYAQVKPEDATDGQIEEKNYHGIVVSNSALNTIGVEESNDSNHRIMELHYMEDPMVPNNDEIIDVQTARQQFYDYSSLWAETNHAGGLAIVYELIKSLVDRGFHPRPISWKKDGDKIGPASMYFQTKDLVQGKSAFGYVLIHVDFDTMWEIGQKIDAHFAENPVDPNA